MIVGSANGNAMRSLIFKSCIRIQHCKMLVKDVSRSPPASKRVDITFDDKNIFLSELLLQAILQSDEKSPCIARVRQHAINDNFIAVSNGAELPISLVP